jgi:hypothetical protein
VPVVGQLVAAAVPSLWLLSGDMKNSYDRLQVLQPSGDGPARLSCGLKNRSAQTISFNAGHGIPRRNKMNLDHVPRRGVADG